jgi:threonine synthase
LESYVLVPANLEEQKLLATGIYGTNLVGVRGNYDAVNRLCTQLAETRPWAFVNVNLRPYYAEGSKTLAYETAEQLGWELPDRVVCPIASGSLFTKVARGFQEWTDLGLIEGEQPVFNGAQALGCSPVATAVPSSPTRSPSRWRSAIPPTARMRSTSRGAAAARSTRSPTRRSAPASACWPRRPGSSPRPPAG